MSEATKSFIEQHKVLVICRRLYGDDLAHTMDALYKGGIRLAEVTFDQADPDGIKKTMEAIRLIHQLHPDMKVGSGTVLTIEQAIATKEAGGLFALSPNVDVDVIKAVKAAGLVSIPGAMTPSEIVQADKAGADFVKVFPAGWLGLDYIKDVRGPINHIKLLATGGVKEENFKAFLDAGYVGAGISGRLIDRKLIEAGDFDTLTKRAEVFVSIANQ